MYSQVDQRQKENISQGNVLIIIKLQSFGAVLKFGIAVFILRSWKEMLRDNTGIFCWGEALDSCSFHYFCQIKRDDTIHIAASVSLKIIQAMDFQWNFPWWESVYNHIRFLGEIKGCISSVQFCLLFYFGASQKKHFVLLFI